MSATLRVLLVEDSESDAKLLLNELPRHYGEHGLAQHPRRDGCDRDGAAVEANATDEKLMLRAFGKWNLANEIAIARDGVEALEYLHGAGCEGRPIPSLVLLDLKVRRIDGLEVLRRVRAHERTRRNGHQA